MNPEGPLGIHLKQERLSRGFSLRALAELAGVSKSALGAWEGGGHLPSLPELDAVLRVYGSGPEERLRVLRLVDAPRARQELRRVEESPVGSAPEGRGSVLRSMRVRRGLSQSALARTLAVDASTIGRWEQGHSWPSAERFAGILDLLAAESPEREAFRSLDGDRRPPPDLVEIEEFLHDIRSVTWGKAQAPFFELRLIEIVTDLWPLVPSSPLAERLYRETCGVLGYWFHMNHGALAEAAAFARRALARDDGAIPHTLTVWPVHILAKEIALKGRRGPREAVEYLESWIPRAAPDRHVVNWYRRDIAEFVAASGEFDAALALSGQAVEATIAAGKEPGEAYFDHARLLTRAGRAEEALPLLPTMSEDALPLPSAVVALAWADALLGVNELDAADVWLLQAQTLIEDNAIVTLRPQFAALARRREGRT